MKEVYGIVGSLDFLNKKKALEQAESGVRVLLEALAPSTRVSYRPVVFLTRKQHGWETAPFGLS